MNVTSTTPAVEIRGLTRRFGDRVAVDGIDLSIARGEIFGVLGPNGSGKTTTMRVLATLIRPTAGSASVLGIDVRADPMAVRRLIGFMPERAGLYEKLTVDTNVRFWAEGHALRDVEGAVDQALRFVDLLDRRGDRVASLSKGLRQRVALARAVVHRPKLLLLDEPSSGLDPSAAAVMEQMIRELVNDGATVVMNTHRLSEADRLCTRVGVLRQRLIKVGTPAELRRELVGRALHVVLAGAMPAGIERLLAEGGCQEVTLLPDGFTCRLSEPDDEIPLLVASLVNAGARIREVRSGGDLERAYLHLMSATDAGKVAA